MININHSELFRQAVESELDEYFAGGASKHSQWAKRGIDPNLLGAATSKYIALYMLVQWTWESLTSLYPSVLGRCQSPKEVMIKSVREFSGDFQLAVVTACREIASQSKCSKKNALLEAFDVADGDMAREILEIVVLRDAL